MNPRDFQQLASELVGSTSAADLRTAISRAYYAAYHVGAEIMRGMNFHISEGSGGHGEVRNRLSNSDDPEVIRVASQLGDLQTMRIHADYRLSRRDVERQKTAQVLVEQANRIIQTLERCCFGPKRTQIINAIQDWERKISGAEP